MQRVGADDGFCKTELRNPGDNILAMLMNRMGAGRH